MGPVLGSACLPTPDPNCGYDPNLNFVVRGRDAAHSRDITALHCFGVEQALTGDEPIYPPIAGDELIEAARDQLPRRVILIAIADAIDTEAAHLAEMAAAAPTEGWELGITIGTERTTVRRLLEHALHDSLHHVDDVTRGLAVRRR